MLHAGLFRARRCAALLYPMLAALPRAQAIAAPDGVAVLYDQAPEGQGGASPMQHMSDRVDEIADDFQVTGAGWTITQLKFAVGFVDPDSTPPGQPPYDVSIYPDDSGKPAATAACTYPATPGVTDADAPGGELNVSVTLPTVCVLTPGRYWVALSAVLEPPPNSMWNYVSDTPLAFAEPVYRNPDNLWGTGCVNWTPAYSQGCLPNFATGVPNMMFQVTCPGNFGRT